MQEPRLHLMRAASLSRVSAYLASVTLLGAACGSPTAEPVTTRTTDGAYTLTFTIPKRVWRADEAVTGETTFGLSDGDEAVMSGPGENFFGFEFSREGGPRITPVWPASCKTYSVTSEEPLKFQIEKSGTIDPLDPNADLLRNWLTDPLVYLSPGQWEITAIARYHDAAECAAAESRVRLPLTIEVIE